MASEFYKDRYDRRVRLSFMFFERVGVLVEDALEKLENDDDEIPVGQIVAITLIECKAIEEHDPGFEEAVGYALEELKTAAEAAAQRGLTEKGKDMNTPARKKGFGADYLKWMEKQDPEAVCLFAAGYDLREAMRLYCEEDKDVVAKLGQSRTVMEWENAKMQFEAVLFGMGGGYGKENETVIDMTKGTSKADEAAIKAMGF